MNIHEDMSQSDDWAVAKFGVGQPVKLMILRNGRDYLVTDYVIEERPKEARPK
mgnify:CR=1 FL=1